MERAGRAGSLSDAGFGGAHLHGVGRRPGRQPAASRDQEGRHGSLPALFGAVSVKVTVRFFASVKEQLGRELEEIEVPAGISTVGGLRAHLRARGGRWAEVLAGTRPVTAPGNQGMGKPGAAIKPGHELAFFPPVTRGRLKIL